MSVWNSGLAVEDIYKLQRIKKKVACHIILGDNNESYIQALKTLGVEKLSLRRRNIRLKFAKKALTHEKFTKWFKPTPSITTRIRKPQFYDVFSVQDFQV